MKYNKNMQLSQELRTLMHEVLALYGQVVLQQEGKNTYLEIEKLRKSMASLRGKKNNFKTLKKQFLNLEKQSIKKQEAIAKAFTLMLELMNSVENAYRSYRQSFKELKQYAKKPKSIVYVLTAHPTEARHPLNLKRFKKIHKLLVKSFFNKGILQTKEELFFELNKAYTEPIVRSKKPQVQDEAESIYQQVLDPEILDTILKQYHINAPTYLRSWVGGDKDGHPGVNSKIFLKSLTLSRKYLLKYIQIKIKALKNEGYEVPALDFKQLLQVKKRDVLRVNRLKAIIEALPSTPISNQLKQLIKSFPALVIPLEFRESSEEINNDPIALKGMISTLHEISKGGDPKWYVRGLIVSMTQSGEDLNKARLLIKEVMGKENIPVIPLFEQTKDLIDSVNILKDFLKNQEAVSLIKKNFGGYQEIMLGYSDSAKEGGALTSRLLISQEIKLITKFLKSKGLKPIFFHGSGGSADRGGGPILEQVKSWNKEALDVYKVTIQGEMVERTFFSPEVIFSQGQKILQAVDEYSNKRQKEVKALEKLSKLSSFEYKNKIQEDSFLKLIASATPYTYLQSLKFGSRPSKRSKNLTVKGLRAIPWVLCWTQTRVLFPFWFGVGSAWEKISDKDKLIIVKNYKKNPAFVSYLKALDYAIAKIDMEVFELYVKEFKQEQEFASFIKELNKVKKFLKSFNLKSDRVWLKESIFLRSPLIHPLNFLQIIAMKTKNENLLRLTVAGIAFGMMATG